ncbi:hypothetical protein ARAF_0569 [Arsenophonus endosymbiont of Aleurodicus floccissimus]|uniref:hypothetical protein n=1 Tax=Arsenophonus endosymbiont of Aleurodicus floccissimus TaxID=2152761 RepID=UPI000E6B3C3E|nr:hypothetical protein [Arsenophonus endosymbiont of Aleurodicus floccissimus]SPP31443.1 hypothetical protein ARAF_0569 [Arsenophonus endosymbiont of Aleurodicus floccissimus]
MRENVIHYFSLIQLYSFASVTTNDKVADEYIYNQNGLVTVCHYDDKIEEKLCFDENSLVDYGDINIKATHQNKQ